MTLSFIVKLGGAAITDKASFETLNEEILDACVEQLATVYKRNNEAEFIIVHGAGSFGHFQASKGNVSNGEIHKESVRSAFVETRCSVKKLNEIVVSKLVAVGIPAVSMSLCGHWTTANREISTGPVEGIVSLLEAGLVPVMHGDGVLDESLGCSILSGDIIVKHISIRLKPKSVIFLTNVDGIFDRNPSSEDATLVRSITVTRDGRWRIDASSSSVTFTVDQHDATGGIEAKVRESVAIAKEGFNVYICKAGTESSLAVLLNPSKALGSKHWKGTILTLSTD